MAPPALQGGVDRVPRGLGTGGRLPPRLAVAFRTLRDGEPLGGNAVAPDPSRRSGPIVHGAASSRGSAALPPMWGKTVHKSSTVRHDD
ncbi:anti-sigma F factor antagonist [Citreicella sp. SE45]|nr:anti-sigma F factor antagonist [Citreicella sp. SE45]